MSEKSLKPSEIFYFFAFVGYTKHVHAALDISWVVVLQPPPKHMFCLQAFSESEPELSSILHTGCYYAEAVLTSPYGINFNRRYQFCMNQKPPLLSSLGMVSIERLDVPKSNKPQATGGFFVPPLKTSLIHMLHPKTVSWANTRDGSDPWATAHPHAAPSTVHTSSSSSSSSSCR